MKTLLIIAIMTISSCDEKGSTIPEPLKKNSKTKISELINHQPFRGYALLIGVNEVDRIHYGNDKDFCGAKKDIEGIYQLLLKTHLYKKEDIFIKDSLDTKWDTILSTFKYLQEMTEEDTSETYLFIYFTGHGALLDSHSKDEKQFLCFYDRMVLRKEILKQLALFSKKTKIYMLTDACYSGGESKNTKSINEFSKELSSHNFKSIDYTAESIFSKHFEKVYKKIMWHNSYEFNGASSICFTSACGKYDQTEKGSGCEKSVFTARYLANWDPKLSNINHHIFKHTDFENDHTFFLKTYPLIFKK